MIHAGEIRVRLALVGGVVVLVLLTACGQSDSVATSTSSLGGGSATATAEVGPHSLDCGEEGRMNVGAAPFYGEPLDDPAEAPSPREMAEQFAERHKMAAVFPQADLVVISAGRTNRGYAWEEPDGTRRAFVAYKHVDWFGGWQSLGDAVCVPAALVSPASSASPTRPCTGAIAIVTSAGSRVAIQKGLQARISMQVGQTFTVEADGPCAHTVGLSPQIEGILAFVGDAPDTFKAVDEGTVRVAVTHPMCAGTSDPNCYGGIAPDGDALVSVVAN